MKSTSSRLGTGFLIFGLVLTGLAAILLVSQPDVYESTTRLQVEKDQSDVGSFSDPPVYDPYWLQTEFEKIQSKLVLFQVISNLGLCRAWGARAGAVEPLSVGDAYVLLKGKLEVSQPRNTSLISITVRSEDPGEAAAIANETARIYMETRLALRRQMNERGIAVLKEQVLKVQEEIKGKQKEIAGLEGGSDTGRMVEAQKELQALEKARDGLRSRIDKEKAALATNEKPVSVVDLAKVPSRPTRSNRLAAYCGLAAGIGFTMVGGVLLLRIQRSRG